MFLEQIMFSIKNSFNMGKLPRVFKYTFTRNRQFGFTDTPFTSLIH